MDNLITNTGIDVQVIVTGVVGLITTVTSGWVSWLFAKKKYNAEVDSSLIGNMQQSLAFYTKLCDDSRERLEYTQRRLEETEKRNDVLEGELRDLRKRVDELLSNICYDLTCKYRVVQAKDKKKAHDTKERK